MQPSEVPGRTHPEDVLLHIPAGADVIVPLANGEPPTLLDVLEEHHEELQGVSVHQMHALSQRPYMRGEFGTHLRHVSYFLSPATREAYWAGGCDLVPSHFSEVPSLLRRLTKCSLVIARAAPPDRHGFFSLGTNADYTASLIGQAPFFLEVDSGMPRTYGENQVHASQVVGWCWTDRGLAHLPPAEPSPEDLRIGEQVAERIRDGSTIQIGIGSSPAGILAALSGHRHLGVHTELLSDGLMRLVDSGVVTGTRKKLRRHKVVATFCLGTASLYGWLHENAAVELLPVDWVNDPRVIGQEPQFVSVNSTTEVDLFGQCASETMGGRYWSGSGGQADFARGAMYSEGGQAFVVLRSLTRSGESRIRTQLSPGSIVTTLKNTVDNVVTEWGVADLRGRPLSERARSLIAIAHPSVRETLEADARELGLL
ncbi:MAG TPA: acetyl-CoA hydrolase/transferase C-terminal domain-containing protein [Acidimicrobiales bacterium]|nr:acetyl-CoA hydrolase/transferase C-terminal domain-containing protein [Acidimicrobiales bacterium]